MKRLLAVVLLLAATNLFAHAGHAHTYMGTIASINSTTQFAMKTTDGKNITIQTTPQTMWLNAEGHAATISRLTVGARVVVKMNVDGKTAASVKFAAK